MEEWERLLNDLRTQIILREQELDLLHAIDLRLLDPVHSPDELFAFIVSRTQRLLQASHLTILLRRSTFLEPMYSNFKSVVGQRVPIVKSLTGLCLESDAPVRVPDLAVSSLKARYAPLRGYRGGQMRSLLATPIRIHGTTVGVSNAESRKADAFSEVHERISQAVAAQIGVALQRTETLASTALFEEVDRLMFAGDDSQHVIQAALERVMAELQRLEHVRHTGAQITFLRNDDELEIMHSTEPSHIGLILPVGKSVSGRAVRERKTIIVGDVNKDPEYQRMLGDSIRSEIAVPILFGEDDLVIGVLNVESDDRDAFYGFYQIVLESFAEKVRTLMAFAKLRTDVSEALEMRSADDLLVAVGDQTSHIIHRLNNTVGAMRIRILELQEMCSSEQPLDADFLDESLDALLTLADRTLKMPDDVTQLLGQGGSAVDVNECVSNAIAHIELPAHIRLVKDLDDNIPKLPLYCFDIVVQNLLQNAVDAMPFGGKLSVSTSAVIHPRLGGGYFQLVVRDSGTGIPREFQKRIFDLNFTTKDLNKRGKGLGLGLWWVRNFVRRAKGDISISSAVGSGTAVTVKIPVDRPGTLGLLAVTAAAT